MPTTTADATHKLLIAIARDHNAEALAIASLPDIRWACGFTGSNGLLIAHPDRLIFLSDGRYTEQAQREVQNAEVHTPGYAIWEYVEEEGLLDGVSSVAVQADKITVRTLHNWRERFPDIRWEEGSGLLTEHRGSKSDIEVEKLRAAQKITDTVFSELCDWIEPGMTEREVGAEIVYRHLLHGADTMSFDPIVASGSNGALPHARPSDRTIQERDLVVIDMGCFRDGYASDMTRTIAVGEPSTKAQRVYNIVLEAQEAALDASRSGITGTDIDDVARAVIKDAGYGEYFGHGLGHGVGLEIHEWPRLSYHVTHDLPRRAVVTVEPGIYLPGEFGVRIEDLIVLHSEGHENLTQSPKTLQVVGQ